jgi:hypothetical protein
MTELCCIGANFIAAAGECDVTAVLFSGISLEYSLRLDRQTLVCLLDEPFSGHKVSVGVGIRKRRSWALRGTHSLFAFVTLFASLEFLFLGLGANSSDPAAFASIPASTYGWGVWSLFNVQGVASTITPLILTLLLAAWVPSYVSLRDQRLRAHFDLPSLAVTGKPLLVCVSLAAVWLCHSCFAL